MTDQPIIFRIHAVQRMFERRISVEAVRQVLQSGEMIEDYSEDMPDPGGLLSGQTRPAAFARGYGGKYQRGRAGGDHGL